MTFNNLSIFIREKVDAKKKNKQQSNKRFVSHWRSCNARLVDALSEKNDAGSNLSKKVFIPEVVNPIPPGKGSRNRRYKR